MDGVRQMVLVVEAGRFSKPLLVLALPYGSPGYCSHSTALCGATFLFMCVSMCVFVYGEEGWGCLAGCDMSY